MDERKPQTVCVVGLGYVGLPTAAMFAMHGLRVNGVDVNSKALETLRAGRIHFEEPGLAALVQSALKGGCFVLSERPSVADVFILAVPTPLCADHRPDLQYVFAAAESIVPYLRPGNLVILESTCPPGTTGQLVPILEQCGLQVGSEILLAYSPERVLPGRILVELVANDRVIGGHTPEAAQAGADLYRAFVSGEILLTDATTAELVKLMENTYRDVNIALANEFSRVAEIVHVDIHEAIRLANHHPRVDILRPGPGVGGHCIAVDPWFIVQAAPEVTTLIPAARAVNDSQPRHVIRVVLETISDVADPRIAILGLAYKADVDDLRESPALAVVDELRRRGYGLRLHDACARALPDGTPLEGDLVAAVTGADVLLILTDHSAYRRLDPTDELFACMRRRRVIDTRDSIDTRCWHEAGFDVRQLGVGRRRQPGGRM